MSSPCRLSTEHRYNKYNHDMSAKEKEPINFCALSCLCIIRNVLHLNLLVEALERYRASWGGVCVCVCDGPVAWLGAEFWLFAIGTPGHLSAWL